MRQKKRGWRLAAIILVSLTLIAFLIYTRITRIEDIQLSYPDRNFIKVDIRIDLNAPARVCIQYRALSDSVIYRTPVTEKGEEHLFHLMNLDQETKYEYEVLFPDKIVKKRFRRFFEVGVPPPWVAGCTYDKLDYIPEAEELGNGYIFIYQRKDPGVFLFLDGDWNIRWYHQVEGTRIKVATRTPENTIIAILGGDEYRTAYGDEILEINLVGEEVTRFGKEDNILDKTIHHEVILNDENEIITLTVDEQIFDLRAFGGTKHDTVKSDGILVLDKKGNKRWEWSVFDVLDPLSDPEILNDKEDWGHANAIGIDKDGNYLVSFYDWNQIWKINSESGELIWKFGEKGDYKMYPEDYFSGQHAVHINQEGDLMIFDNGTDNQISRTLSFTLDEQKKSVRKVIDAPLEPRFYSGRSGSSYLLDYGKILQCSSNSETVLLTDRKGDILWYLRPSSLAYRAEYIPANIFDDYYTVVNR
jgi:hypothetical protein